MVEFIEEYFLFKYGLQKIASTRLDEFLFSALKHSNQHKRIKAFLIQLGMLDIRHYHRGLGKARARANSHPLIHTSSSSRLLYVFFQHVLVYMVYKIFLCASLLKEYYHYIYFFHLLYYIYHYSLFLYR